MVAPKPITDEELTFLSDLVAVDPESQSGLTWKKPINRKFKPGDKAGYLDVSQGYWKLEWTYQGKRRKRSVHTLVLELSGQLAPSDKHEPDHKDRDRSNNRLENLSWKTRSEQCYNKQHHENSTGYKYVYKRQKGCKFAWTMMVKRKWIGESGFTTAAEAHAAAVRMREQLGLDGPEV